MTDATFRRAQSTYVTLVVMVGLAAFVDSIRHLWTDPPTLQWFVLAALTLLTGSFTVKLPSLSAKISVSETFVFTSVLLFGPHGGTITVILDALVISLWMKRAKRTPVRVLFNSTAPAIAIRIASETFFYLSGTTPGHIDRHNIDKLIIPSFLLAFVYFVANTVLVAGALGFERRESPLRIWYTHFPPVSITYFVGSSVALLIVAFTGKVDITVFSIIVPLLLISYLTFRTSMGRLEDATRHVAQLNELYLSTVETLAMAVDAKDQITHGHIRRVQVYAVGLARRLGIAEGQQLKAIEAAALLHDMGKLAIPEHILNKPGQLTPAEFAKMKRHADIGADLISSIAFPYPVIPIVRHHHENWDGSGYPLGMSGTDIPLGARVLSVVDCFDALTSDRPYRPRLTPEEAFIILMERAGSMYDPLVVETFAAAYSELAPIAQEAGDRARSLTSTLASSTDTATPLFDIRATAAQTAYLSELSSQLERVNTLNEMTDVIFQYARRLTPATVCAVYRHNTDTDGLVCISAAGDPERLIDGLTIRNGERISGWAAANDRTIANSKASLDLGAIADGFQPPLQSALATPVKNSGQVVGTLTVYSTKTRPFDDDHRYAIERIADAFGTRFTAAFAAHGSSVLRFSAERHLPRI